jgi:arylsulfatase A-like enzyme
VTVAQVLQHAGYATGLIGKWGLGSEDSSGAPRKQGFDYYFGFLNQTHAHNHFPDFLWRNGERVALPNGLVHIGEVEGTGFAIKPQVYANDLFFADAERFVTEHRDRPFFLYLAITTPHANNERTRELGDGNEVPEEEYARYASTDWKRSAQGHAAMITRMDRQVGSLLAKLKDLGLDEKTLVIFTSDNGPHRERGPDYSPEFFQASGPWRGIKRDLTEGGIRVPFIARWPGKVPAGVVSGEAGYLGDMMATFADLAGASVPQNLQSITLLPVLTGAGKISKRDHLYWEFYEGGVSQAVLIDGRWKAIRARNATQLFDLSNDPGETKDLSAQEPKVMARVSELFKTARADNEHWRLDAPAPATPP